MPVPVVIQFIVDRAARKADPEADAAKDASEDAICKASDPGSSGAAGLVTELPLEIDQALAANGYKTLLGAPALNTLVHRIAVLSKAHQLAKGMNPCGDPLVRGLLARTRRAYAQRGARNAALTKVLQIDPKSVAVSARPKSPSNRASLICCSAAFIACIGENQG
jgi:hypothetical protein